MIWSQVKVVPLTMLLTIVLISATSPVGESNVATATQIKQITVQEEPKVENGKILATDDSDTVDTNLTSSTAEPESTVATKENVLDESPNSQFLRGNWGRIFVREVQNCYEATNESVIVSTVCNQTDLRQVWRLNDRKQIVNFHFGLCLTPVNLDGRDPKLFLDKCTESEAQKWVALSQSLNDFTIQSSSLQQCLDVNGYAVRRTEAVQLGVCEPHFDDFGRISDQYLQFEVSYTQIRISITDAVVSQGDAAKLSCQLQNTPKAPDYVMWTNGRVQIEEFTSRAGYGISTGVFTNNSMLSILTVDRVDGPGSWTCMFIVDRNNFSAVSEVDTPSVVCDGLAGETSMTASMKCCYTGKYEPTKIFWQRHGKTVKETARSYQITATTFDNRTQCSSLHFPKTSSRLTFSITFQTKFKSISQTMISGPIVVFSTSPPWRSADKTTFPSYRVINDVEDQENVVDVNNTNNAIEDSIRNGADSLHGTYLVAALFTFLLSVAT
ncbi:uncharacterized protein LOC134824375 [Bolinopsis microptera]|uniref:uncharacterized protein LOC134824375 n=1 Tax=Bolinopsis microptera TaxID=2820187 RepID=UPI00307A808D